MALDDFPKILRKLELQLQRQEATVEATRKHISAIKALEKIEAKAR